VTRQALRIVPTAKNKVLALLRMARQSSGHVSSALLRRLQTMAHAGMEQAINGTINRVVAREAVNRASVLARAEAVRAFQHVTLKRYEQSPFVLAVRWVLSPAHPHVDICDMWATADIGLGPGVWYRSHVPWPAHVGCLCSLVPILPAPETLDSARPYEPRSRLQARQAVEYVIGPAGRQVSRLGARKQVDMAEIKRLIDATPKAPHI
jgi:hypothetical protein